MTAPTADDRSLPLRERKRLRTRRALTETALRLFTERGFDATTLDDLVDEAEVSRSTFFRNFPAKEAVAIEAEVELWTAYLHRLRDRKLSGPVLAELHRCLADAVTALDPGWDGRYLATRRLILTAPALLAYVDHYRTGVEDEAISCLATALRVDPDDLRLHVLARLTTTCWSVSGRDWVRRDGRGGRQALVTGLARAYRSVPESLALSATPR
ncbi:TetR family transcriptional regulator [Micromonospora thermarum]|uniref:TetR family transcriptional regulator n=1 Tax=Micromonospora thermarum TaxID=2720024 RepID=A0ABX0Z6R7_9ACTN|nr:TetR family transcriptional regulator [Micromonospora thermarum]NJP33550.1 TetR family transcriptional regulator [Micromonospora thermarum]